MTSLLGAIPLGDHHPCASQAFQNRAELHILFTTMNKSLTKTTQGSRACSGSQFESQSITCRKARRQELSMLHPLLGHRDKLTVVLSLTLLLTLSGTLPAHGCCCPHSRWVSSLQLKLSLGSEGNTLRDALRGRASQ